MNIEPQGMQKITPNYKRNEECHAGDDKRTAMECMYVYRESPVELRSTKQLSKHDPLSSLNLYLDKTALLRVASWLEVSKYPIILPYRHYVTRLILNDLHHKHLHCVQKALLAIARRRFLSYRE